MNETAAHRRGKEKVELIRSLEKKTREVVETEQLLARQRDEQTALRDRLLDAVGGRRRRKALPDKILDTARAVESGATTISALALALGVTSSCARMRLLRAIDANLVDRVGHGDYRVRSAKSREAE